MLSTECTCLSSRSEQRIPPSSFLSLLSPLLSFILPLLPLLSPPPLPSSVKHWQISKPNPKEPLNNKTDMNSAFSIRLSLNVKGKNEKSSNPIIISWDSSPYMQKKNVWHIFKDKRRTIASLTSATNTVFSCPSLCACPSLINQLLCLQ